jgi:hypothetical protein
MACRVFSALANFSNCVEELFEQILRSITVLSIMLLIVESSLLEWMFHADALLTDAVLLQKRGQVQQTLARTHAHTRAHVVLHTLSHTEQFAWAVRRVCS